MNIRYFKLAVLPIFIFLYGCAQTPDKVLVTTIKKEPIYIPSDLFNECKPVTPLSKEEYLKLHQHEREGYLASYIKNDIRIIIQCNNQLQGIKLLYDRHINLTLSN